jgi:hypothetical protein
LSKTSGLLVYWKTGFKDTFPDQLLKTLSLADDTD